MIDDKHSVSYSSHDTGEEEKIIYVNIYTDGFTKILRFANKPGKTDLIVESADTKRNAMTIHVEINEIGISIVGNVFKKK